MKTKRVLALVLALIAIALLASCDMINDFIAERTRAIPLIQVYNSNREKTFRMVPNDTLYVEVRGLKPDEVYTVQSLDPNNNVITEMITIANEEGIINPAPLWYDVGFKINENGQLYLPDTDLSLSAFHIKVFNEEGDTNFKLPFFIVSSTAGVTRAKPIVMAGKQVEGEFFMENAFYSEDNVPDIDPEAAELEDPQYTDMLFINVANMSPLVAGQTDAKARIWILPFAGDHHEDKDYIVEHAWFYKDFTIQELIDADEARTGVLMEWPVIGGDSAEMPEQTINLDNLPNGVTLNEFIPEWAEGRAYSVFLDMMDRDIAGVYNVKKDIFSEGEEETDTFYLDSIDGNGVAGFIVREPPIVAAEYVSLDLASGGMFKWVSGKGYDYDFRDKFIKHGLDTKFSSWYGVPYGIKIVWNPYAVSPYWGLQPSGTQVEGLFWGRSVDVYIVTTEQTLNEGDKIGGDDGEYIAEGTVKQRLPVQYGCGNGLGMQTIWRAPMKVGDYMVIVDMDGEGKVDNSLVDDERKDGGQGGFSVVESY